MKAAGLWLSVVTGWSLLGPLAEAQPVAPNEVGGLVAWYDARTLYDTHRDRETVVRWPDASGNGHDLAEEGNGLASTFRAVRLNELPVVKIGKGSSFAVADPFVLEDHTIFLVHRSSSPAIALFSALKNDQRGVVLARDAKRHLVHNGTSDWSYNSGGVEPDFAVTMLLRRSGRLHATVNGADVSGQNGTAIGLEVGRLFHIALSRAAPRDAEGLLIAELIFYNRALEPTEQRGITETLAAKYGLELGGSGVSEADAATAFDWTGVEPLAKLSAATEDDLNVDGIALSWAATTEVTAPLRHDPEQPTRLYCERDARVHVSVRLRLLTSAPGTALRILVMRNESEYLLPEGRTEPDPEAAGELTARFDLTLEMNEGDWVEVVTSRDAAEGTVTVVPGKSTLRAVSE